MDIRFLIEQLDEITRRDFMRGLGYGAAAGAAAGYMSSKDDKPADTKSTEPPKTQPPPKPVDNRTQWFYNSSTDQMTGEDKGGKARAWSTDGKALIEVYFGPNTKDIVFVEVKNEIINFGVDGTSVRIKAGGKVINAHLDRPTSGAYDYGGVHEEYYPGLIKRLFAGGEIKVEVPIYRKGPEIYTWNLKPFDPSDPYGIKASKKDSLEETSDEAIARIIYLSKDKK